jgi:O-antigen/teichoic acid export membrane protein
MVATPTVRRPSSGRDAGWLGGADLIAVVLAFFGQILLANALLAEHYGWMVLAIDLYASLFLMIDLGLPTLLARDGAKAPEMVRPALWRIYRWQCALALPFILLAFLLKPDRLLNISPPSELLLLAALIGLAHIASYAPRSGLRVLGEARLEAVSKLIERTVTVLGYATLYSQGSTSVVAYTVVFLMGAAAGWLVALAFLLRKTAIYPSISAWSRLDLCWDSPRALMWSALPFAITLGILPYVIRIEKFMVAASGGSELAAVFHVAQLAWLAGLVVPAALRSALLPVLGESRGLALAKHRELNASLDMCFALLPYGLFGGYLVVAFFAPMAFPASYFDGTYGVSAVDIFTLLLLGWSFTLLATPTYTSLMAGQHPWRFTQFIVLVLILAVVLGWSLVLNGPQRPGDQLMFAALASSLSAGGMLVLSWIMSEDMAFISARRDDWALALLCSLFIVVGLMTQTAWWLLGLPLFLFTKQGLRAVRSTLR